MSTDVFEKWWADVGSSITPLPGKDGEDGEDMEEHAKRVARVAWDDSKVVCEILNDCQQQEARKNERG